MANRREWENPRPKTTTTNLNPSYPGMGPTWEQKFKQRQETAQAAQAYKNLGSGFKGIGGTNYGSAITWLENQNKAIVNNNNGSTKILGNDLPQDPTGNNNNNQTTSSMPRQEEPPKASSAKDLGVVKNPARDVTDISSLVPQESAETITRLLFEQFSAIELAQILTSNTVDGIDQQYSIISNLSDIRRRYNSTKQLTVMDKLSPMDGVFAIDINSKIPGDEYIERNNLNQTYQYIDENGDLKTVEKGYIYIDTNGDLIIEFDNMLDDEFIQVQIDQNGTIYKVIKE